MDSDKTIGVSSGMPITQDDIERYADEAEQGYDDDQLRRASKRGRPTIGTGPARTIQTRPEPEPFEAPTERVEADHSSPSQVVRDALHDYLAV